MMHAVVSGDVVAFTSLSVKRRAFLEERFSILLSDLSESMEIFGRVVRGDFLEFYVPRSSDALRVMLLVKSFVRSQEFPEEQVADKHVRLHLEHGIRLALGMGALERLDLEKGVLDGEAIYMSGRLLNEEKTHDKQRITVKRTLFFKSSDSAMEAEIEVLVVLLDEILKRTTGKQSEVLYHRLMGKDEKDIAAELGKSQSTINQHTTQAGWSAIECAVNRFETLVSKLS
ncbi:hypothetical protein MLD52_10010 [Puniceicoccaceae bacterium K14]|nr:hypothetical protein [Puniceicoccaceae bacterium K14]